MGRSINTNGELALAVVFRFDRPGGSGPGRPSPHQNSYFAVRLTWRGGP
jgi:hypothetical protein